MSSIQIRKSLGVCAFLCLLIGAWFLFWGNTMLHINGPYDTSIIYTALGLGFIFAIVGKGIFRTLTLIVICMYILIILLFMVGNFGG
ncbi:MULTISPECIES: hypothetical protein [Bacillus]|uniref:hypothetical protein n=1 Tax=Bacillus TaxID=1386 RepID=UPI0002E70FCE|nr:MULTISPECIES: hypothetical protein [Bacillus]